MMNNNDLQIFERVLRDIKEYPDKAITLLEAAVIQEREYHEREYVCDIVWCIEDIVSLRPDFPTEKIKEIASYVSKGLQDRSTEEGWETLENLIDIWEYDNDSRKR